MRSVVVVLPASMCAMIPMLRVLSSATLRAMFSSFSFVSGQKKGPCRARCCVEESPGAVLFGRSLHRASSPLAAALRTTWLSGIAIGGSPAAKRPVMVAGDRRREWPDFALPVRDPRARGAGGPALAAAAALLMLLSAFTTVVSVDVASGSCEVAERHESRRWPSSATRAAIDRHSVGLPAARRGRARMGSGAGRGGSRPAAGRLAVFGAVALGSCCSTTCPHPPRPA